MCVRGEERSQKRRWEEEARRIIALVFQAYGRPLDAVLDFKYLGRVLTASYDDWPVVVENLRKVWRHWVCMLIILGR